MKPNSKKVAVLIAGSPHLDHMAHETVRMTVGLTLRNPDVYLFLLGRATEGLQWPEDRTGHEPPFGGHLSALLDLGCPVILEKEALQRNGDLPRDAQIQIWSREEIILFLSRCQAVVIYQGRSPCRHGPGPVVDIGPFHPALCLCHQDGRTAPVCPGDLFPRILHLSAHAQGDLFREVIDGQKSTSRVTVVLSQNGSSALGNAAGNVFEAISNDTGEEPGCRHPIGYGDLLDLIFQHDTVICW